MNASPAVELRSITKYFGDSLANDDVSLSIARGEIHGVIGENGAGKSTLMKIVYGFYRADRGEIWINGEQAVLSSPEDAIRRGIGMVHQHFMLVEPLTVLENVILGAEPKKGIFIDRGKARREVEKLAMQFHLSVPFDATIEKLSVGEQQQVEILKLLYRHAEILILDEPTAVLAPQEVERLFDVLRGLRDQGKTIIMITHKMNEILALTDRVTVMRAGKKVGERVTKETNREDLARLMVGREVTLRVKKPAVEPGEVVLEVDRICARGNRGEQALRNCSFTVRAGEIVGIAGVMGNGQSELEEVISGLRSLESGSIRFLGADISNCSVNEVREKGLRHLPEREPVGHVPEDRHRMGVILDWSVEDNFLLGYQDRSEFSRHGRLLRRAISKHAEKVVKAFDVKPPRTDLRLRALSGGNQQKVVLGRELDPVPKFALIAQPTRGVDIGAIEFIHRKIVELRSQGSAILLISAELEEILNLSDRIIVLFHGEVSGEARFGEKTPQELGLWMTGGARA